MGKSRVFLPFVSMIARRFALVYRFWWLIKSLSKFSALFAGRSELLLIAGDVFFSEQRSQDIYPEQRRAKILGSWRQTFYVEKKCCQSFLCCFQVYIQYRSKRLNAICKKKQNCAVKWLIASKINVFVYIMCVCVYCVCLLCIYKCTHIQYIFWKYLHVYIYIHRIYIIYKYI